MRLTVTLNFQNIVLRQSKLEKKSAQEVFRLKKGKIDNVTHICPFKGTIEMTDDFIYFTVTQKLQLHFKYTKQLNRRITSWCFYFRYRILIFFKVRITSISENPIFCEAPVFFQNHPYFCPYRRYHSNIRRLALIVARFWRKVKIGGFCRLSTRMSPIV